MYIRLYIYYGQMDKLDQEQFEKMTKKPVSALIISLAIPTITSMLVSALYNTADTYFVSKIDTSASAAVGIVFAVMALIQAIGFTFGMGSGTLISRRLGEKDNKAAFMIGSTAIYTSVFVGLLLTVFGLIFIKPLIYFLGSTDTVYPYAKDYISYILLGAPIMCASFVLNNILRSEGKARLSMIGLTSGGLLNIVLDPIFIFTLGLGTSGAAIATVISQAVSLVILLSFFIRKKTIVKLSLKYASFKRDTEWLIIKTGLPSFLRQILASAAMVFLNVAASGFGDAAIAAMAIVNRLIIIVTMVMFGIGQGFIPVSGYNFGAKLYGRVRKAYFFTLFSGAVFLGSAMVLLSSFAPYIIAFFRDDPDVISLGASVLRFQSFALPFSALVVSTNMLLQSTGQASQAAFLAATRQGLFFIPLVIILPRVLGLDGLKITQMVADLLSFAVTLPFLYAFFRKLKRLEKEQI